MKLTRQSWLKEYVLRATNKATLILGGGVALVLIGLFLNYNSNLIAEFRVGMRCYGFESCGFDSNPAEFLAGLDLCIIGIAAMAFTSLSVMDQIRGIRSG